MVSTHSVYRLEGDRLVGDVVAHYATTDADSVLQLTSEGTRAPRSKERNRLVTPKLREERVMRTLWSTSHCWHRRVAPALMQIPSPSIPTITRSCSRTTRFVLRITAGRRGVRHAPSTRVSPCS